jgi:dephospho-CoA kinase
MKIIGIGGLPRSGKDTLAELLIQSGYFGFSFGDYVRERARLRHQDKPDPISVENMTETSNWLRQMHGPDVVLQAALKEFNDKQAGRAGYEGLVLYSVRAPVEVDWILTHDGQLVWVEASDQTRYQRQMNSRRPGEAEITPDEFKRQENLQWQPQPDIPSEAQMNVEYVKSKATKILTNNTDNIEDFIQAAQKALNL